jgi:alpha-galactosidase
MTDDFHKQGMLAQIWWLPLGVEDGQGKWESHKYVVSKIVQEHPEWLILDKNGKHARMTRGLAALCPAVPEVRAYHKQLTEKFIRDWGFDGSKLDNIYSVPACYNPAHHHKSPQDSVNAMGDIYKEIFQTTRALKPESVTQSCPCGTPPSLAWLPFMDQAVTADPVGAVQVRRRIKMYKALLGPESAVYGDHVELSAMTRVGNDWKEHGEDFASTIGAGGVVGTKFVWPDPGPKFKAVNLTARKKSMEEVDRPLQREDAFEGRVPRPVRDRIRLARGLRHRERRQDVLRVLCPSFLVMERRSRTARTQARQVSRERLQRGKRPRHRGRGR